MAHSSTLMASAFKFLNSINKWALYLVIFIWPFGHLLKFSGVYLLDIACILSFIAFVLGDNIKRFRNTLLFKSLNLFWFSLLVSILYSLWRQSVVTPNLNFLYFLRALVYPFLAFSFSTHWSADLKKASFFSILLFLCFGIVQYLILPDLRLYKNLGFDDHYYRLAGTLLDPNFTGAILATFIIFFLTTKKYLLSIVFLTCLTLTFSRASYLAFLLTLIPLVFQKKAFKLFLLLPLLALLIYVSPKPFGEGVNLLRTYSISSRATSWGNGLQLFAKKPVMGNGFGHLTGDLGQKVSVDNSYIYLLAGSGLLGLASFIFVLFAVLKTINKNTYLLLLPILIHSIFNNSLFYIWIMALFWILVGFSLKENKSA